MQQVEIKTETLSFENIELSHEALLSAYLKAQKYRICDFSFVNMYAWRTIYGTSFAIEDGMLFIRVGAQPKDYAFLPPIGDGDFKKAVMRLVDYAKELDIKLKLVSVPKEVRESLETLMGTAFEFTTNRDGYDYLYEREKLSTYSGKKLHGKKNHINKFQATYNWRVEEITRDNIEDCVIIQTQWCAENECDGADGSLSDETCAVRTVLSAYFDLPVRGLILYVDDEPAAYSIGSEITEDTFDVHIEKALTKYDGVYSMICMQMAKICCEGFTYMNREEDLGDEGLRKSKLSYRPVEILSKDIAVYKL
ncbi:MAG: DUF2156 domain-containing protein [Clostridia bacterium]|nr:DUF2156 domain-containing protein [Clostridia bacterium]